MRRLLATVAVAGLATAGLAACAGTDPHKNMHCVRSHDQSYELPIYGYMQVGKSSIPYVMYYLPETHNVCDQWVPNTAAATHG